MDRFRPDSAVTALASVPAGQVVATGRLVCADDLPDGLVVADHLGRILVFNHAATRLTGIAALNALGRIRQVLPLRDSEDRSWWTCVNPFRGLSTRTRHPELPLYLPDGSEFLGHHGVRADTALRAGHRAGLAWFGSARRRSAHRDEPARHAAADTWSAPVRTWSLPSPTNCVPR